MDITEIASLLATWVVISDEATIALEALALLRVTGVRRWADVTVLVLPLIEEHRLLWDTAIPPDGDANERSTGDIFRIGRVLAMLGGLAFGQGDLRSARSAEEEALSIFRSTQHRCWEGLSLWYLATLDANERNLQAAAREHRESLGAFAGAGEPTLVYKPLIGLAAVAAEVDRPKVAAWLLGSADEQLRRVHGHLVPFDLPACERAEQIARRALGDTSFAAARRNGQQLGMTEWLRMADEVIAATSSLDSHPSRSESHAGGGLTAREQDVLRLLVEGRSNPEIADELFVGVGTAKTHVANILAKLGVPTRAAAATYAVRQGLI